MVPSPLSQPSPLESISTGALIPAGIRAPVEMDSDDLDAFSACEFVLDSDSDSSDLADLGSYYRFSSSDDDDEEHCTRTRACKRARSALAGRICSLLSRSAQQTNRVADKRRLGLTRGPVWGNLHSDSKLERFRHRCTHAHWIKLLIQWAEDTRLEGSKRWELFRQEFNVSRSVFDYLCKKTEEAGSLHPVKNATGGNIFSTHEVNDGKRGPPSEPLIFKIAGSLKVLTTAMSFKDAGKLAGVSKTVLREFFHGWMQLLVDHFYKHHVYLPLGDHLGFIKRVYEALGFPGAFGSTDGVHVFWQGCVLVVPLPPLVQLATIDACALSSCVGVLLNGIGFTPIMRRSSPRVCSTPRVHITVKCCTFPTACRGATTTRQDCAYVFNIL